MNSIKSNDDNNYRKRENTDLFKGKYAIEKLHENITKENEKNLNLKISDMYNVDVDEATEIHVNYHKLRLENLINKSEALSKVKSTIENYISLENLSSKVVLGEMTESTCVDIFIRMMKSQKDSKVDRYINFYN